MFCITPDMFNDILIKHSSFELENVKNCKGNKCHMLDYTITYDTGTYPMNILFKYIKDLDKCNTPMIVMDIKLPLNIHDPVKWKNIWSSCGTCIIRQLNFMRHPIKGCSVTSVYTTPTIVIEAIVDMTAYNTKIKFKNKIIKLIDGIIGDPHINHLESQLAICVTNSQPGRPYMLKNI